MKKITLLSLLLFACHFVTLAQFTNSTIPDYLTGVPSGSIYDSKNISAYSFSNLIFSDGTSSLYVYSWDLGGFGWVRKKQGTSVILDQGYIATPYSLSTTDIAIVDISPNGGPYTYAIALAYRNTSGVFVDLYKCNLAGVTLLPTISLSSTGASTRVSLDAHKLNNLVAAWDNADGYIHVKTIGFTSGSPAVGTEKMLQVTGAPLTLPDVAIGQPTANGGLPMTHFVALLSNRTRVYELKIDYNTLAAGIPATFTLIPEDVMTLMPPSTMFSNYPKIDCPDNFPTDDWTYVVPEVYSTSDSRIRMARRIGATPISHSVLNDGLNFPPLPSILGATPTGAGSMRPCVGYTNNGTGVNVLWSYSLQNWGLGSYNYIGLSFDGANNLVGTPTYKVVDYAQRPYGIPGIGISTQNDNTEDAFAAYFDGAPQQIYYKNIPWGSTGFRPGNITGMEAVNGGKLTVETYPNPFATDIQLRIDEQHSNNVLNVSLSDITGKTIATFTGDINAINSKLSKVSGALGSGTFFVNIQMNDTGEHTALKVIKL